MITFTDDQMLEGMHLAASREGLLVSPESGAAIIAARILREQQFLNEDDEVVIFSTGSGLMHTDLIAQEDLRVVGSADASQVWMEMIADGRSDPNQ